ncbi:hypothetical protein ACIBBD_32475 [Streptomyces sp. NPDC051315]|uniref:hypothetical protein n=1 Tax=Streptomyces sp. NPDC051315 TaxID=3365650 RepID=UPI00379E257E
MSRLPHSEQHDFAEKLDRARKELFEGTLTSTDPAVAYDLEAGESDLFTAYVKGGWQRAPAAGRTVTEVRAGAQIGMKLRCSGSVTCTPLSSERQNVLTKDEEPVEWTWKVTARREGTAEFALTMTAYYLDTATVLFEKPVVSHAEVSPRPAESRGRFSWVGDAFAWLKGTIEGMGALAGSLAAVVGLVVAVRALRGRRSGEVDGAAAGEDMAAVTGPDDGRGRPAGRSRPTSGT